MKRNIKNIVFGMILTAMVLGSTMVSMAGEWQIDAKGFWWKNDDGSYPTNCWQWLDSDQDGIAQCYYFGADGYRYTNRTTPDQYQVDASGFWVVNGVVQTKEILDASYLYLHYNLEGYGKLPGSAYENEKNRKAVAAYYQALKTQKRFTSANQMYSNITVIDADQDGVVELFVRQGDENEEVAAYYLFSYVDDKVSIEELNCADWEMGQIPNENKVLLYAAHESPFTGYEYTVENGYFKKGKRIFVEMNEEGTKMFGDEYSKKVFGNKIELEYIRFAHLNSQNDLLYPSGVSSF